jgi:hypothetical protein
VSRVWWKFEGGQEEHTAEKLTDYFVKENDQYDHNQGDEFFHAITRAVMSPIVCFRGRLAGRRCRTP